MSDAIGGYFDRDPERLVLEGYRHWMAGYETGSVTPWEMTFAFYSETLGATDGRRTMGELAHFIRTLRRCAACPLRCFPFGAHHVCRDECLTLGLIAGIQHDDREAAKLCVEAMTCRFRAGEVAEAAAGFATALSSVDQFLLPIPPHAIEDVLMRSRPAATH